MSYGVSIAPVPLFVIKEEEIGGDDARFELKNLRDRHRERYQ